MNKQMKWTFKSHKGIFIPVIHNQEIKGLRIHLEGKYKLDTTDIWLSSVNEYQGTSASNNIMIFIPEEECRIKVHDIKNIPEKDIIIASDILMGYRLFNRDRKITIAVPNKISKQQAQMILNNISVKSADIYFDEHTIKYDFKSIFRNLLNHIPEEKQKINCILNYKDLIKNDEEDANIIKIA